MLYIRAIMSMRFAVVSSNQELLALVRDFALGLGLAADAVRPTEIVVSHRDGTDDVVLELLSHVALCAARTGVDSSEPLCTVTYVPGEAPSEVTLGLRIAAFDLKSTSPA